MIEWKCLECGDHGTLRGVLDMATWWDIVSTHSLQNPGCPAYPPDALRARTI